VFSFGDHFAGAVEDHAAAVEHQFVVAADLIAKHDRALGFLRKALEHGTACGVLAQMPGRCRNVQYDACPRLGEFNRRVVLVAPHGPEILVVPDVLANRDPDLLAIEGERFVCLRWFEVTIFVEHVIRGQ